MKQFLSIFFSFLFALHAHAGLVLERIDGTIWDQVERLRVPNNQITKLGDKRYRLETGNENVLKNPNFQAAVVGEGWTVNTSNLDSAIFDNTLAFEGAGSLQLDLKQGNYTDLELISQTFPAGYKLGGADLEAFIRIAKSSLNSAVQLKWCAHVDGVLANCVTVPSSPADTYFQRYLIPFSSKPAFATSYKVGLYATYNVASGVVGILNLATAGLQPYQGRGVGAIVTGVQTYTPVISSTGGGSVTLNATGKQDPTGIYWIVGDRLKGQINFRNGSGGAASGSAGVVIFSLPPGFSIDLNKMLSGSDLGRHAGYAASYSSLTASQFSSEIPLSVRANGTLSILKPGTPDSISVADLIANAGFQLNFDVPIQGRPDTNIITPEVGANLLGTHFYTREPTCPVNSVSDNATITRAQYPALFAKWQIAAGTDTLALANAGLVIRSTGTQTFGGETYTATLNQKRNDAMQAISGSMTEVFGGAISDSGVFSRTRTIGSRSVNSTGTSGWDTVNFSAGSGTETHGPDIAHTGCYWAVANPFLPISGMVTSNSQSSERIERARFSCQTSSVVNNQSTGFIASIGNAVDAGTYRTCTVAFNTPFASQPECPTSTVLGTGTLPSGYTVALLNITTSGFTLVGPDSDFFASVVCMGPR